jgi:hypothetical protein
MKLLRTIWEQLIGLLVDDGFLAIAALVAIALTWLLAREDLVGPSNATGWTLFVLLVVSVTVSCRRAVKRHVASMD